LRVDGTSVSSQELYARLGPAAAPVLVDVRRAKAFGADDAVIMGAMHRPPESVSDWRADLPKNRAVVVYCVHGPRGQPRRRQDFGRQDFAKRRHHGGLSRRRYRRLERATATDTPQARFIREQVGDPRAPKDRPHRLSVARQPLRQSRRGVHLRPAERRCKLAADVGGTPYDIEGVEFGHVGERCSFDAIVRAYDIHDPALDHLATIVRGADTSRPDLAPQCEGLLAISYGLSANFRDDHDMLKHGLVIYDALYAWCRSQQAKPRV
jgi:hypothetical protein